MAGLLIAVINRAIRKGDIIFSASLTPLRIMTNAAIVMMGVLET